jgi:hypothetical protein
MILDLHALRNPRQENCIILLTYTSGVIKKLHSPRLSPIKVLLLKKIHLWQVRSTATFISISVNKDRCIHFRLMRLVPSKCSHLGHSVHKPHSWDATSHTLSCRTWIPLAVIYRQLLSNRKPTPCVQYHVWFSKPQSTLSFCPWYNILGVEFTSVFRCLVVIILNECFLPPPVGDLQDSLVMKA